MKFIECQTERGNVYISVDKIYSIEPISENTAAIYFSMDCREHTIITESYESFKARLDAIINE